MTEASAAADALSQARQVQARIADSTRCPPYMHGVFGGFYGAIVGAQGFALPVTLAVEGVVLLAVLALFVRMRRRLGFFVNGYRRGRTRWAVAGLLVPFLLAMGLAAWARAELHLTWPALVLGLMMCAVGALASYSWQSLYQSEITAGPPSRP